MILLMKDNYYIYIDPPRHCEEASDVAIPLSVCSARLNSRAHFGEIASSPFTHANPSLLAMTRVGLSFIFCLYTFVCSSQYTQYVNPFIGTGGHGHTFPGAVLPFGMVALSPDTRIDGSWDGCSGYHYSDSIIYGFSHTHLSGTGCSDLGDIMLMPTSQTTTDKNIYSSKFSHKFESAKAGKYDVYLQDDKINVALTATTRCGFHEYKWNETTERKIVLDLRHRDELLDGEIEIISPTKIEGYRRSKAWATDQWCFYSIEFSEPFKLLYNSNGEEVKAEIGTKLTGKNVAACFIFSAGTNIMVKVGISGTDREGARKNLQTEIPHWDFQTIYTQADSTWNKELSCIEVDNISKKSEAPLSPVEVQGERYTIFYTALYHCFIHPSIYNDVDHRYRGRDGKIHIADSFDYYTVFSLWDTYRALHPLFNIVQRKRNLDFIKTFLAHYDQVGRLPIWEFWGNETDCMIGYHAVSVITDAYIHGIRDFDVEKAYKAMTSIANSNWRGLDIYRKKGYLEVEDESESVSKTLEYSYDDWCIAQMAQELNKTKDSVEFYRRSKSYINLAKSNFFQPRQNGGWLKKFDPYEVNNNYTEANAWQYMFIVDNDNFRHSYITRKLDSIFNASTYTKGRVQSDITGMLGQYSHGNEPSHNIAFLYGYTGKPWKTSYYVNKIMNVFYQNSPDGLIGNEDCGQMSAWYVWAAIGAYPIKPGGNFYSWSGPLFENITLNNFTKIISHKQSDNSKYITSMSKFRKGKEKPMKGWNLEITKHGGYWPVADLGMWYDSVVVIMSDTTLNSRTAECLWCSDGSDYNPYDYSKSPDISYVTLNGKDYVIINFFNNILDNLSYINVQNHYIINGKEYITKKDSVCILLASNSEITAYSHVKSMGKDSVIFKSIKPYKSYSNYYKKPNNWSINISSTPHPQYTANGSESLIDGLYGSTDWRKGRWQGYQGSDLELVLDLQKIQTINEVGGNFLQDVGPWIMMPKEMIIYTSEDSVNYTEQGKVLQTVSDTNMKVVIQNMIYKFPKPIQTRYIKIKATNYGKLPQWHISKGEPAYIFVDEVWMK